MYIGRGANPKGDTGDHVPVHLGHAPYLSTIDESPAKLEVQEKVPNGIPISDKSHLVGGFNPIHLKNMAQVKLDHIFRVIQ